MARTIDRYAGGIVESVQKLAAMGLVDHGDVQVRVQPGSPTMKVYLLNKSEVFFGFYPVLQHEVTIGGQPVMINDPMGKDTILFHQSTDGDPESAGGQYVTEAARWFDSVWSTIASPYQP